ncbi:hypothetical protein L873DRAFT_1341349 [Choiromyces venosus 120613-1]|uniref:Uncharacterized protein n=1 Tax=Choiromyces venosus 120613-1 TaxID=1336337 RepID=A0A3N4JDU0_9PEZI|nr:hypothetical protein L873DRAFT_1341349 [Choiromyces venosus 120613-1]
MAGMIVVSHKFRPIAATAKILMGGIFLSFTCLTSLQCEYSAHIDQEEQTAHDGANLEPPINKYNHREEIKDNHRVRVLCSHNTSLEQFFVKLKRPNALIDTTNFNHSCLTGYALSQTQIAKKKRY